jgi:hypothetical protein
VKKRTLLLLLLAATVAVGSSVAYAATLGVTSWHLWAGAQSLTKATCTVTGAQTDTYVDQAAATSSFGSAATLGLIPSGDAPKQQWTFVKFDLSSCNIPATGGADSATMSLYLSAAPSKSFAVDLTRVTSAWAGTLTWNQAQTLTYAGSPTTSVASGTAAGVRVSFTVTGDIDAFIKGGSNFGWRVSDTGSGQNLVKDTAAFASTESGANVPTLTVNYEK